MDRHCKKGFNLWNFAPICASSQFKFHWVRRFLQMSDLFFWVIVRWRQGFGKPPINVRLNPHWETVERLGLGQFSCCLPFEEFSSPNAKLRLHIGAPQKLHTHGFSASSKMRCINRLGFVPVSRATFIIWSLRLGSIRTAITGRLCIYFPSLNLGGRPHLRLG